MQRVGVKDFLAVDRRVPIVDVRSPGEYYEGHITKSVNIPLFSDDERAQVGTTYTKVGREEALELGLEIVGPKMNDLAKKAKAIAVDSKLKVHCWRGGMRSDKMAWLFDLVGLEVTILEGGYKAYRNQLMDDFLKIEKLIVLQGPTGCGKTDILKHMKMRGEQIINLEKLANHRGSAFGGLGMADQPATAQFQNNLYNELLILDNSKRIWIESESLSIGRVYLPQTLWENMNASDVIELMMDKKLRVKRLLKEYGSIDREQLSAAISKIRTRFGGNRTKLAIEYLEQDQLAEVASLLLEYYDKSYAFSKNKYKKKEIATMELKSRDAHQNAIELIKLADQLEL